MDNILKTFYSLHYLMTLSLRWMYVCMCACMYVCKEGSGMHKIRGAFHLDCNSEKEIHLITSKKCKKQYVGSCILNFAHVLVIPRVVIANTARTIVI